MARYSVQHLKKDDCLPYADKIEDEALHFLRDIKTNLGKSILLNDFNSFSIWNFRLQTYLLTYGLKVSKEDYILLIKILYGMVATPTADPSTIAKVIPTLLLLINKKRYLTPVEDLILDWRPLYEVCQKIFAPPGGLQRIFRVPTRVQELMRTFVHTCRFYFDPKKTPEILREFQHLLCPMDVHASASGINYLMLFLPISADKKYANVTYELWLDDLIQWWSNSFHSGRWDQSVISLLASLAYYNVGKVNWEPYIPILFSRFQRMFKLPVKYKNIPNTRHASIGAENGACLIAYILGSGSSCQERLDQLLQTLVSYCRPANNGFWVMIIRSFLKQLTAAVVNRLRRERCDYVTWENQFDEANKLTDEDVERFVRSMHTFAMQALFSPSMLLDLSFVFRDIAIMKPSIVVPPLIDKMFVLLDSVTEPHKLIAVISAVCSVSRPMIEVGCQDSYKEGITHIMPILFGLLPAIDGNDFQKCILSLSHINTIAHMVPFIDCSTASLYYDDLTPEEEVAASATAQFEEFVLQFLDRCFSVIETNTMEHTRLEHSSKERKIRSSTESNVSETIHHTVFVILQQCSPEIFKTALKKVFNFVISRIFEPNAIAAEDMASLINMFAKVNPEETFKLIIPTLSDYVLEYTSNPDIKTEERLESEFLYKLMILSEVCDGVPGNKLMPYLATLTKVAEQTVHLRSKEAYTAAGDMLFSIIASLCTLVPHTFRSYESYDQPTSKELPLRSWGKGASYASLKIDWYIPAEEEIAATEQIIWKFLIPELQLIDAYVKGEKLLTRDEIKQSLDIIKSLSANTHIFQNLEEPPIQLFKTEIPFIPMVFTSGLQRQILMLDGSTNILSVLIDKLSALQTTLLQRVEDDTDAFLNLIAIWNSLLFGDLETLIFSKESKKHWKLYRETFTNKLKSKMRYVPFVMKEEVLLKHEQRINSAQRVVTESHRKIAMQLLQLATSHYSTVRYNAQSKIFRFFKMFPYSYTLLKDELIKNLSLNVEDDHERFKGTLYLLLGPQTYPFVVRPNYEMLSVLYPAIVRSMPSEKSSIIKLMENISDVANKNLSTITFNWIMPEYSVKYAKDLWSTEFAQPNAPMPSTAEINRSLATLDISNNLARTSYRLLMQELLHAAEHENLQWRYQQLATKFMMTLVHTEESFTVDHVRFFLNALINDSINIRKIAVIAVGLILKQNKPKLKKELVNPYKIAGVLEPEDSNIRLVNPAIPNGCRPDNLWLQYNCANIPHSEKEWNEVRFVYRGNIGYCGWPRELYLYSSPDQHESLDKSIEEMSPIEKEFDIFFSNSQNIDKMIRYYSLEDRKETDKFRVANFVLFKNLFKKTGDKYLDLFKPHLDDLVQQTEKCAQICACEIISGIISGARFWPYDKSMVLMEWIVPLLRKALDSITAETGMEWASCFSMIAYRNDVNKISYIIELLSENPLKSDSSYKDAARLLALNRLVATPCWKMPEFLNSFLLYIKPILAHPYQQVRQNLGLVLYSLFESGIPKNELQAIDTPPLISKFLVADILPRLRILLQLASKDEGKEDLTSKSIQEDDNWDPQKKEMICLLKTVCKWIMTIGWSSSFNMHADLFELLPLLIFMEGYERTDAELTSHCKITIATLSVASIIPENIHAVLSAAERVSASNSWTSRFACLEFLQVFVFYNLPLISSNPDWVNLVTSIVEKLLIDSRIEVCIKAGNVVSGFLHCKLIRNEQQLLDKFTKMSEIEYKNGTGKSVDTKNLSVRHAGILGLCAFINANPYDVNEYVPPIFATLDEHLSDPEPIISTICKSLSEFKRTHYEDWETCKQKFTLEQLTVLSDMLIPPPHYA